MPFAERWARATRCKASLDAFVRNFGKHETATTSDDARAARVKKIFGPRRAYCGLSRAGRRKSRDLRGRNARSGRLQTISPVGRGGLSPDHGVDADGRPSKRVDALAFLTCIEIDAPDVESLAPFSDALIALKEVPFAETLRRSGKITRSRRFFICVFAVVERRQGQAAVDRRLVTARHPGDAAGRGPRSCRLH